MPDERLALVLLEIDRSAYFGEGHWLLLLPIGYWYVLLDDRSCDRDLLNDFLMSDLKVTHQRTPGLELVPLAFQLLFAQRDRAVGLVAGLGGYGGGHTVTQSQ